MRAQGDVFAAKAIVLAELDENQAAFFGERGMAKAFGVKEVGSLGPVAVYIGEDAIERAVILSPGTRLQLELPTTKPAPLRRAAKLAYSPSEPMHGTEILRDSELREIERSNLHAALQQTRWKIAGPGGAAELLGVRPTTLASRIRKLGIERPV
jgi:hypothetical protein